MSDSLLGLGDNDIEAINRQQREELVRRNPENRPEVVLSKWTLADLTVDGKVVRAVVYGVVTESLTDKFGIGEIICSPSLIRAAMDSERRIYASKHLRFECRGRGNEITIPESDLRTRLPNVGGQMDDLIG